jgi:predicted  nucleic acid-binding Zn-ribbon protein
MNKTIGVVVLVIACVGLAIALVVLKSQSDAMQKKDSFTILQFSNDLDKANIKIDDLNQTNLRLSDDLDTNRLMLTVASNELDEATNQLATTTLSLQDAQLQITNLNARINDLETQNQVLDQRVDTLSNTIVSMDTQITVTQMKLAVSETNNTFLEGELKREVAQENELEHKFNDLKEVRDQVHKLRDNLLMARRLAWMRQGVDPTQIQKGGQIMMQRSSAPTNASPYSSLNVEVNSDGSVHVIPPLNSSTTNPPAAVTNTPPQ